MQLNTLERRRELIRHRNLGLSLADAVKVLAQKHNVTRRTIYHDWQTRKTWLPALLEIGDPATFFLDIVAQHREIYRLASLEFLKADNSNARIGALRLLRDLNLDFAELVTLREATQRLDRLEANR